MLSTSQILTFSLVSLLMVLTPGPNMIYLISRSISQGRWAGLISLAGVALGFVFYMLCAALGITSFVVTIPYTYDAIRISGAAYLLYLAYKAIRSEGNVFSVKSLNYDQPHKLFLMGFFTNLLNPKIAIMYLSLLPQFLHPEQGHILMQSVSLGLIQIMISVFVNAMIVFSAAHIAQFLQQHSSWAQLQKWLMGTVLSALALRILLEQRH